MLSAAEALRRLREGNCRFAAGHQGQGTGADESKRKELVTGQAPFAIILGCSDSRVPAELIFDRGLGDLFVIRVAGNVVAPSQVGSIEFAAEQFGTRLVVVLGHSRCGAIQATLQQLEHSQENRSPNLRSIVDRIRPAVEPLLEASATGEKDKLVERAVRANIRMSANQLRHGSQILEQLVDSGDLMIVGAEYSLETGVVNFFEGVTAE